MTGRVLGVGLEFWGLGQKPLGLGLAMLTWPAGWVATQVCTTTRLLEV